MVLIDKDLVLTNFVKLQSLRFCLLGPALNVIRSLDISSANYPVALDLFNKRYSCFPVLSWRFLVSRR